jgi:hypothetical protein
VTNKHVVAVLWTLAAITLVCWFAGLVSEAQDARQWSYSYVPTTPQTRR